MIAKNCILPPVRTLWMDAKDEGYQRIIVLYNPLSFSTAYDVVDPCM